MPNPIMNASGTAGYGCEDVPDLSPQQLGGFVTKGLSLRPRYGNPPPRIAETPAGLLNAIGLENVGVEEFARTYLPPLREKSVRVVVNFFGESKSEYVEMAGRLDRLEGIWALEMNVSCPNVERGGRSFGMEPSVLFDLVRAVREVTSLPLLVKLPPETADIVETAQAAWEGGCDALTVANTYLGLAIDVQKKRPILSFGTGGLSGPAIKPLTLYRVWVLAREAPVPVVGVGGIASTWDALEYLIAGATAVQIGTGIFVDPALPMKIRDGIVSYLMDNGHKDIKEIIGSLQDMP
jgi:dihydroorotate dehydrogenase (NAD+) catalytic subunit